jgi:hypothetical protein
MEAVINDDLDLLLTDEDEPFYKYIISDKSMYKKASETINPKTGKNYIDPYDYLMVDDNGHFLLNIDF